MIRILFLACISLFSYPQYDLHAVFEENEDIYYAHKEKENDFTYVIVGYTCITHPVELQAFMIMHTKKVKFNVYVLDYWDVEFQNLTAYVIVKKFKPVPLEAAKMIFLYDFTNDNYGF